MPKPTLKLTRSYYKHPNVSQDLGYYIYYTDRFDEKSITMMSHIYHDTKCEGSEIDTVKELVELHGWELEIVDKK